jgi:DNA-directed RNA polymerase subunit RPC12/RpoP
VANPISARRDASSWYECVNCSYQIEVESVQAMPNCPSCNSPRVWEFHSGGHSKDEDPDD